MRIIKQHTVLFKAYFCLCLTPDFTNRIEDMRLQDLAEGDSKELVACVHEVFGDFVVLDHHHALIPLVAGKPHMALAPMSWDFGESAAMLNRLTEGLASLMLSLRRRFQVRYQRGSEVSQRLAQTLHHLSAREQRELFDFGNRSYRNESAPLLLIIDRKDDPVTPLLSQWTYQAMLHEVLGLFDNRVSLRHVAGIRPELEEAVLDPASDSFYASTMYSNFGDVGMAVKSLVDGSSWKKENGRKNFDSLDEMAEFVEGLPELSQQQSTTAKHVTLMTELSHAVEKRSLMQISSLEQDIVCGGPQLSSHFEAVLQFVRDPNISGKDKLRLIALFALRYERDGKTQIGSLMDAAMSPQNGVDVMPIKTLLKWCPAEGRVMDIFADRSLTSRIATLAKQHLKGVENVYTQHTPPIVTVLERAARGKLSDTDYINVSSTDEWKTHSAQQQPVRLVVCCIVGGTTYEEVKAVAELNAAADRGEGWAAGVRFILVGTGNVQNSATFMADWDEVAMMERYHARSGYR